MIKHSENMQTIVKKLTAGALLALALGSCHKDAAEPDYIILNGAERNVYLTPGGTFQIERDDLVLGQSEPFDPASVTFASDNGQVATVSAEGLITAVAEGEATVTAQVAGNAAGTIRVQVSGSKLVIGGVKRVITQASMDTESDQICFALSASELSESEIGEKNFAVPNTLRFAISENHLGDRIALDEVDSESWYWEIDYYDEEGERHSYDGYDNYLQSGDFLEVISFDQAAQTLSVIFNVTCGATSIQGSYSGKCSDLYTY